MTTSEQPKVQIIDVGNSVHGLVNLLNEAMPPEKLGQIVVADIAAMVRNSNVFHQQSLSDFTAPQSDHAYSRARVRKYLFRHGLRGAALKAERDRVTTSYAAISPEPVRYPYGWPRKAMTRLMKRMFHGHEKPASPVVMDEFWYYSTKEDSLASPV